MKDTYFAVIFDRNGKPTGFVNQLDDDGDSFPASWTDHRDACRAVREMPLFEAGKDIRIFLGHESYHPDDFQ